VEDNKLVFGRFQIPIKSYKTNKDTFIATIYAETL